MIVNLNNSLSLIFSRRTGLISYPGFTLFDAWPWEIWEKIRGDQDGQQVHEFTFFDFVNHSLISYHKILPSIGAASKTTAVSSSKKQRLLMIDILDQKESEEK